MTRAVKIGGGAARNTGNDRGFCAGVKVGVAAVHVLLAEEELVESVRDVVVGGRIQSFATARVIRDSARSVRITYYGRRLQSGLSPVILHCTN